MNHLYLLLLCLIIGNKPSTIITTIQHKCKTSMISNTPDNNNNTEFPKLQPLLLWTVHSELPDDSGLSCYMKSNNTWFCTDNYVLHSLVDNDDSYWIHPTSQSRDSSWLFGTMLPQNPTSSFTFSPSMRDGKTVCVFIWTVRKGPTGARKWVKDYFEYEVSGNAYVFRYNKSRWRPEIRTYTYFKTYCSVDEWIKSGRFVPQ